MYNLGARINQSNI